MTRNEFGTRKESKRVAACTAQASELTNGLAVFIDSEFWHGKNWDTEKLKIKNDLSFWQKKIEANVARDVKVNAELVIAGWSVLRFWGEDIKKHLAECTATIENKLGELKNRYYTE